VKILPIHVNTGVAGFIPIKPRPTKLTAKRDRIILYSLERYLIDLVLHLSIQGSRKRTKIASPIVNTPPNLSGIALKIA
jgi:hypothetical protein